MPTPRTARARPATDAVTRDVVLLGMGKIGRAVLNLMAATPAKFTALRVVAVVDRGGAMSAARGLSPATMRQVMAAKMNGASVATLRGGVSGTPAKALARLSTRSLVRPILVDLTAHDTTTLLTRAARNGFDLVLANKRPLTATWARYRALLDAVAARGGQLRHEATVSAGLPVILALRQLLDTGDRIIRLEGCLSGTLAAVLSDLDDGVPFSAAVREAHHRGVTEPDPRDDLTGQDVARKALILARMLGRRVELADVHPDSLVKGRAAGTVGAWLSTLTEQDVYWRERARAAHDSGTVLRYVATVTPRRITVGLRAVPREHPLGQLRGAANQLVITSGRYHGSPLIITGPGGGPVGTATGVLADLLALTVT